jgi:integrase
MKGNLTRRGARSWRLKYDIPTDNVRRETRYITIKATTRREAQVEASKIVAAIAAGAHVDPSGETVARFISRWLDGAHGLAGKTLERYRQLARHQILPHLGAVPLQRLRRSHIIDWHGKLLRSGGAGGGPLTARTVGHAHRVLHRALERAFEAEIVARNVAHGIKPPKVETKEIDILKAEEIEAVLVALADRPLRPIVVLALSSGARRGELLALRWGDVDLGAGTIRIERSLEQTVAQLRFKSPKTKYGRRTITLPPVALEALQLHRRKQLEWRLAAGLGKPTADTLVFSRFDGEPIPPNGLSRDWANFVRTHKLPAVSFHALRHTHASTLIASGLDALSVSRRLGHGSAGFTLNVYSHLFSNTDDRAAAIMEKALTATRMN